MAEGGRATDALSAIEPLDFIVQRFRPALAEAASRRQVQGFSDSLSQSDLTLFFHLLLKVYEREARLSGKPVNG